MKPVIVYFHRYPIEDESDQNPTTQMLIGLLASRFEVVYFSMRGAQTKSELRRNANFHEIPFVVNRFKACDKWLKLLLYYFYLPFALLKLKRLNPSFIICKETLPLVPSLILRLKITTLIDISDWWLSIMFGKRKFGRFIAAMIEGWEVRDWRRFNVFCVTHTKAESSLLEQKGMSGDKIHLINAPQHEGVYFPANASDERRKLGFGESDWVVAVHGIIHPSKGYDQILEWWALLIKYRPNWKLLIIGGSGEEARCRQLVASLKLDKNVVMTGWLAAHSDVNNALNAADCLMVTRRNSPENIGVIPSALFHSLALNKPTVITGLPGMSEVVEDKVNGFIFEPDNFDSFKSTLEFVYVEKDLARIAAEKGMKTAKESFDLATCARKYFELIENAVHRGSINSCSASDGK